MKALEGKNIGVVPRGTGSEDIARTLFNQAGVDPDARTYIATGLPTTALAALESKPVDMAINFEPALTPGRMQCIVTRPFSIRDADGPPELQAPDNLTIVTQEVDSSSPPARSSRFP